MAELCQISHQKYQFVQMHTISQTAAEPTSTVVLCSLKLPLPRLLYLTYSLCSPLHSLVQLHSLQLQCFAQEQLGAVSPMCCSMVSSRELKSLALGYLGH